MTRMSHPLAVLALAASFAAHAAPRPTVDLQCVSFGAGPQLECTVRLSKPDGKPLTGANVMLSASMPAMPMAHHVRPAVAAATGTPGEYRGRIQLEMSGAWAVQVDVAGPVRERIARTLQIDGSGGDRRRSVSPAAASAPHHH